MNIKKIQTTENGFTLIEILIAMLLAGVVTLVIYQAFLVQEKTSIGQQQIVQVQQNLRAALYLMEREIMLAGLDMTPGRSSPAGIELAHSCMIRFTLDSRGGSFDVDGDGNPDFLTWSDGDVLDENEDVSYGYGFDGTTIRCTSADNIIRRRTGANGGGDFEALAEHIERIAFEYGVYVGGVLTWDVDDDSDNILDATGRSIDDIRAVRISLLGRTRNPLRDEMRDTLSYNLQPGADGLVNIYTPPGANDQYRRRLLTKVIKLRNMGL